MWSQWIPLYSRISCTAMPMGAPPRQTPTRKEGRKPLRTTCSPSSIESRNSDSAEMKIFSSDSGVIGQFLNILYGRPATDRPTQTLRLRLNGQLDAWFLGFGVRGQSGRRLPQRTVPHSVPARAAFPVRI